MYAPGCDHRALTFKQKAQKVAHIAYIRQQEAEKWRKQ